MSFRLAQRSGRRASSAYTRKRRTKTPSALAGAAALVLMSFAAAIGASNTLVPAKIVRYAPSPFPDRIIVMPGANPQTNLAVAWRTDASVASPLLQISIAGDAPDLADHAREIRAESIRLKSENGDARHHQARIDGLRPDTLYAYRVQGANTWSEWFHIRTAAAEPRPFSFLYFGDAQNSVKSLYSRVIREAWRREPGATLMIHAGDLVNGRARENDTEWGEWFDAGGFLHSSALSAPAPGNHEHRSDEIGEIERYTLEAHWAAQFPVPGNGAPGLKQSTWFFDYQGVRFITLDSTSALNNDTADVQARWLAPVLENNPNRWTVVSYHHPMVSASRGRDNPVLRTHWMELFERHGVDLVLQGHDHVYGRGSHASSGRRTDALTAGPVYVVSVAGPKQYRVADDARRSMIRHGENTQLYQVVRVEPHALRYEARTATGELYDAFELKRDGEGVKRLIESTDLVATRGCPHERSRSGKQDRCWDGTEW